MRKINKISLYLLTATLLPFLFLFGCTSHSGRLLQVPADLKIAVLTGGIAPGQPVLKLEIDAQGNCVYYESRGIDKAAALFRQIEAFKIPPEGMYYIYKTIMTNDFSGLSPQYINKQVLDGNFAKLTVTENNRTHTVRTQNIKVARFDKIMIAINVCTPGMNKVIYNQISWFTDARD